VSSEKTEAIVLRAIPWSETSLVVTLWTRDFGKLSAIAKGARRLRSPFESALDLLAHSSVVFLAKAGDVLDLLTEAKLVRRFRSGQQNLLNLYCGYYVAELLLAMTEEGSPIAELFELTQRTLEDLDASDLPAEVLLRFEMNILRLDACVGCGEVVEVSESVAFGIESGGVLCQACLPGQRSIVRLKKPTLEYLTGMQQNRWETTPLTRITPPLRAEIRGLMNRTFMSLHHRPFTLHGFLEGLAR
jgi:DNA repair protein RecO (recombination protein O)